MNFFGWWNGQRGPGKSRKRHRPLPTGKFLPRLEILEDRVTPSTLTVKNTNDSGDGSLRQAILGSSSGDTIKFASSLSGQKIILTSGELDIAHNLKIQGLG